MLSNKNVAGLLTPLAPYVTSLVAVPVAGHDHHPPQHIAEIARGLGMLASCALNVAEALEASAKGSTIVLILGSLYLAGEVLSANDEAPV